MHHSYAADRHYYASTSPAHACLLRLQCGVVRRCCIACRRTTTPSRARRRRCPVSQRAPSSPATPWRPAKLHRPRWSSPPSQVGVAVQLLKRYLTMKAPVWQRSPATYVYVIGAVKRRNQRHPARQHHDWQGPARTGESTRPSRVGNAGRLRNLYKTMQAPVCDGNPFACCQRLP